MGTAIKHPVPDRVKPSFVIFDIRALGRSGQTYLLLQEPRICVIAYFLYVFLLLLDINKSLCLFAIYLLNICELVHFVCGLSPPKRRVVRWRNFAHRRVTTCAGHVLGFMSIRVVVTKIMTFFYKMHVGPAQLSCALLLIAQALGRWPLAGNGLC